MKVAFIGLGNMGQGMASRLLEAKFDLTVYNRTVEKTAKLVANGAKLAQSPRAAAKDADVLITMVHDDVALSEIMSTQAGTLEALKPGAIHLSMSTISDALAERLALEHATRNVHFVGAPVFGRPAAAAGGKLFVLAGGDAEALKTCEPILNCLAQKVVPLGAKASDAHLSKILGNFMLFSAIEALAEAVAHARVAGLNERKFLDAMTSTIFISAFYQGYGNMMVEQTYPTEQAVSLNLALKDIALAVESTARFRSLLPGAEFLQERLRAGIADGYGPKDVSALTEIAFKQSAKHKSLEEK